MQVLVVSVGVSEVKVSLADVKYPCAGMLSGQSLDPEENSPIYDIQ